MSEVTTKLDTIESKDEAKRKKAGVEGDGREYVHCPCCGAPTLVKPVEIKGDILEQFIACTITGESFKHAYSLFSNRINVIVQSIPRSMSLTLSTGVKALYAMEGKLGDKADKDMVKATVSAMRIYVAIDTVKIAGAGESGGERHPCEYIGKLCEELDKLDIQALTDEEISARLKGVYDAVIDPEHVSGIPFNTIIHLVETHNNIYGILLESGFDSNFWKGIELV